MALYSCRPLLKPRPGRLPSCEIEPGDGIYPLVPDLLLIRLGVDPGSPPGQTLLTKEQQASLLARRIYDLRHACLSAWLNAGVPPAPGRQVGRPQRRWSVHVQCQLIDTPVPGLSELDAQTPETQGRRPGPWGSPEG